MTIIKSKKLLWSGAVLLMNCACDFPCKPLGLPDKISSTIHYLLVKILSIKEKKPFIKMNGEKADRWSEKKEGQPLPNPLQRKGLKVSPFGGDLEEASFFPRKARLFLVSLWDAFSPIETEGTLAESPSR